MNNSLLHETILRDIVDAATDIRDTVDDVQKNYGKSISSIAKASSDLVLVFPFMCDSTVSLETSSMTAKAIERQCVTMLRLLFSSCQIGAVDNGLDFIRQFHTNIKNPVGLDDFMGYMDNMVESGQVQVIDQKTYRAVQEEVRHLYDTLPDNISETSLSEAVVLERYGSIEVMSEARSKMDRRKAQKAKKAKERAARADHEARAQAAATSDISGTPNFDAYYYTKMYGSEKNRSIGSPATGKPTNANDGFFNNMNGNNIGNTYNMYGSNSKSNDDIMNNPEKLAQFYKNMMDAEGNRMIDSDVKKANELVPTMMTVNFVSKDEKGNSIPATFVCGVKCRLIPVDPMDIADRILVKHADKNVLLSFIRATTRETSFIKDFLFAIDKAKIDAVAQSRRGSSNKMWKVLERRAIRSKWNRAFSHPNDASMITTLGISQELAEYIKKENGIDLSNPRITRPIMEGFNLMGFVIIDEAGEADKFLWDTGEGYFETISFNNLEREASGGEYKKALNLMQKMYR